MEIGGKSGPWWKQGSQKSNKTIHHGTPWTVYPRTTNQKVGSSNLSGRTTFRAFILPGPFSPSPFFDIHAPQPELPIVKPKRGRSRCREHRPGVYYLPVDVERILEELRANRRHIEEALVSLERLAFGRGKRRGAPPAWMTDVLPKRRGRLQKPILDPPPPPPAAAQALPRDWRTRRVRAAGNQRLA